MFNSIIGEPFDIITEASSDWTTPARPQPYYRLAFIQEGEGMHCTNGNAYPYQAGKLFLLAPDDAHHFDIQTPTRFIFIRFTQLFVTQLRDDAARLELCDWMKKTDYIFNNYHAKAGCIFRDVADEQLAHSLLTAIAREKQQPGKGHQLIIRQAVSILLNLIARNLLRSESGDIQDNSGKFSLIQMISYLQENIYQPEMLRMPTLAARFHMSVNYLGEYFKKHTGQSVQDYIISYKLKLVETRLSYSNMRIREIAQELGFSDESYLSRLFKKHKGLTPGAHRRLRKMAQFSQTAE
ncbi:helix-turn-helix transcriptional regulator [Chitinophaga sp. Mgbs1]|uniref:Helix-turn-helix transcriptional regulator n=1 Tax=Chitinophaga solisilvae TaxID=1233460 RepID=A0A9Q5D8P0_9BACT|nr:helix-turn-helix transcriptional regulator [Chitinophaga solisilvae]